MLMSEGRLWVIVSAMVVTDSLSSLSAHPGRISAMRGKEGLQDLSSSLCCLSQFSLSVCTLHSGFYLSLWH